MEDEKELPVEVRKACLALELLPGRIELEGIQKAWEQQTRLARLDATVNGQVDCDSEVLAFLNKAKQTLTDWLPVTVNPPEFPPAPREKET